METATATALNNQTTGNGISVEDLAICASALSFRRAAFKILVEDPTQIAAIIPAANDFRHKKAKLFRSIRGSDEVFVDLFYHCQARLAGTKPNKHEEILRQCLTSSSAPAKAKNWRRQNPRIPNPPAASN